MKKRARPPFEPPERIETVRKEIMSLLGGHEFSAKDISALVRVSEKDVFAHLEHIRKTMDRKGDQLAVKPPACVKCGFVFRKRERLKKPGKCPVCRGEQISEPLFSIVKPQRPE